MGAGQVVATSFDADLTQRFSGVFAKEEKPDGPTGETNSGAEKGL